MNKPSRTAWAAAVHRAAHQILEKGSIFAGQENAVFRRL